MKEIAEISEEYANLAKEVIQEHEDISWIPAAGITILYLESDREKKKDGKIVLGECIRIRDLFKCLIPADFIIAIYAPNVIGLSRDQLKILLYHELLHVGIDDSGEDVKYIVNPHDIEEFKTIIDQYGYDWTKR